MKNRRCSINQEGFSLITAVVALVILAIGLLGVAEIFTRSIKNNGSAGGVSELTRLSMKTAEKVMMLPDDRGQDTTGIMSASGSEMDALTTFNFPDKDDLAKKYVVTVQSNQSTADPDLIQVDITAKYTDLYATMMGTTPDASETHFTTYRFREPL